MGERLGELVPDEGATQHDRDLGLGDPRDHPFRLVEVLEVEEVLRILSTGRLQRVRTAARRDKEPVVRDLAAWLHVQRLLVKGDLVNLRFEPEVDAILNVPFHVTDVNALLEKHAT